MNLKPAVYLVEDDARMRSALEMLLCSAGFQTRAYANAESLLCERDLCGICLLADFRLPGMDGLALHRLLTARDAAPSTIIMTGYGNVSQAVCALKAGVVDFLEKPVRPAALLECVSEASRRAIAVRERQAKQADLACRLTSLSRREVEVLDLLARGDTSKVIASRLAMSVRTAEHHRARIMEKLGVSSTVRLVGMLSYRYADNSSSLFEGSASDTAQL